MLNLSTTLTTNELLKSTNIATLLPDSDLAAIAGVVMNDVEIDLQSRADWEIRNADALKLALQISEAKTTPWPDASNVMFPLVTIAALQCHAREYPALISGTDIVRCQVIGQDPDGIKTARAKRVSAHMSYQILEEDSDWEEQMDHVMFTKPILGCAFKKVYFDAALGHNVSEMVMASDLILPYKAKSLEAASRITHRITRNFNYIHEKVVRGVYIDSLTKADADASAETTPSIDVMETRQGIRNTGNGSDETVTLYEQHRTLDLDGDGYEEPYIVTVAKESEKVLRIVAAYYPDDIEKIGGKIVCIKRQQFFIKYGMIPSPDGGIYDIGFGVLLGPLNHSVNTIINQLIDAGTLHNMGGGFLGRGAKLRRGQNQFVPGEWKQVDSTGNDLRASVIPLPTKEPSQVLFALLGMLVNYGERISGSTDIMVGQNVGQNTPASTAQEMVKQGSVIFGGIFKRTYRSMKREFRMLYRLNQLNLTSNKDFQNLTTGDSALVLRTDYDGPETEIRPTADPNVASVERRLQQAIMIKQAAATGPGYDAYAVEQRFLEAAQVPYINEVWSRDNPIPQNPKIELEKAKLQFMQMDAQNKIHVKMLELMQKAEKTQAEIMELQARAAKEFKEAEGVDIGHAIAAINLQIAAHKVKQDGILESAKILKDLLSMDQSMTGGIGGGVSESIQRGRDGGMAAPSNDTGGEAVSTVPTGGSEGAMG